MIKIQKSPDVDIDVGSNFKPASNWVRASIIRDNKLIAHNSGYYIHNIKSIFPQKLSIISYDILDQTNISKVDFLHNTFYDNFNFRYEILDLIKRPVNWSLLTNELLVKKLMHVSNRYKEMQQFNINSVPELADFLALMRPGKIHLMQKYLKDKSSVANELYAPCDKYYFKKSHAYAYATLITVQMRYFEGLDNVG